MVKISIIIPVYNSEKTLEKCLKSILCNNSKLFELILINDGSMDNSEEVCLKFKKNDARIKYVYQENNGVSAARNRGIEEAIGQYIMFVDADDMLDEKCIDVFLEKIDNNDFLCAGYKTFMGDNQIINTYESYFFRGGINEFAEKIEQWISIPYLLSPWSKLFKNDIIKSNNIRFLDGLSYGEDVIFVFEYLRYAKEIISIPNPLYLYRISNKSLSADSSFKIEMFEWDMLGIKCMEKFLYEENSNNISAILEQRFLDVSIRYFKKLIKSKYKYKEKKKIFFKIKNEYNENNKYNILKIYKENKKRSNSAKIVYFVLKYPKLFIILYLLKK